MEYTTQISPFYTVRTNAVSGKVQISIKDDDEGQNLLTEIDPEGTRSFIRALEMALNDAKQQEQISINPNNYTQTK